MGRKTDHQPAGPDSQKARKPWKKPEIRRVTLTGEELTALRQSDDPEGLLRKMWPEVKGRDQT